MGATQQNYYTQKGSLELPTNVKTWQMLKRGIFCWQMLKTIDKREKKTIDKR